ncbi:hypothetical protein EB796_017448 [Bugula neritina]|uniref:Uncharacterized protein n=1 Tax=Bugula neritina TaxID=10212 RepID=A0A7J7JEI1_BUGNE|nr:hypothetical protein EB796_017448 [Bugula neritina]
MCNSSATIKLVGLLTLCTYILATPSHSNTAGVTECQDGLLDLYTSLTSETTCSDAEEELTELLGSCRPSDTVHMVGLLREILRAYVYTSTDCVTSACSDVFKCMQPIINQDSIVFDCDSLRLERTVSCIEDVTATCDIASILRFTLTQSANSLCKTSKCITEYGIYTTVPGTDCHRFNWLDYKSGNSVTLDTAPGTMFQTDLCIPVHDNTAPCYN